MSKPHIKKIDGKWVYSDGYIFGKGDTIKEAHLNYDIEYVLANYKSKLDSPSCSEWIKPTWMGYESKSNRT